MTPVLARAAKTLVAHEAGNAATSAGVAGAAERACEKLRRHLARVVGDVGMHALFGRALALSRAEYPWLPRPDGAAVDLPWGNLSTHLEAQPAAVAFEATIHFVATLLGLLARFIGDDLTLRLLVELWPAIPVAKETT